MRIPQSHAAGEHQFHLGHDPAAERFPRFPIRLRADEAATDLLEAGPLEPGRASERRTAHSVLRKLAIADPRRLGREGERNIQIRRLPGRALVSLRTRGMREVVGAGDLRRDDHTPGIDDELAGLGSFQDREIGVDPVEAQV